MRIVITFFTLAIATIHAATSNSTTSKTFIEFKSKNGDIYADNQIFYFKGVNWFGTETIEATLQGLWPSATTVPDALDLLAGYDINALRLPLALDSVLNDPEVNKDQTDGTPSLAGKSYLDILDYIINEARKRNMVIILDNHRIEAGEPDFPDTADPTVIIPALERLAARYCTNPSTWNVVGIDIKNEPKGKATWGDDNEATDWSIQAATIGNAVLAKCPRWLIFVEGVQNNIKGVTLDWGQVGGSLQGAKKYPVKLKNMERLVYSPHVISPGVDFKSPWWSDPSFPKNMNKVWTSAFGSTPSDTKQAVVVGAWGSKMDGIDGQWATQLSSYLVDKSIGSFYWAFNPQSANTGGLIKDDWKTPIAERFELLSTLPSTKLDKILSKYATCTTSCTGYGQCTDGKCVCYAGWSGPQCDICTPGDTEACNKGGTCQKDSTCLCDDHVGGKYCGGIECDGVVCGTTINSMCLNGQCVCKFNCIGNQCTSCAANASMITNSIESCDTCAAAVKDESHANGLIVWGIEMLIVVIISLMI